MWQCSKQIIQSLSMVVFWVLTLCGLEHSLKITTVVQKKENYHSCFGLILGFLVERNTEPQGIQLINPFAVAKHESTDLVDLAREIQRVSSVYILLLMQVYIHKYTIIPDHILLQTVPTHLTIMIMNRIITVVSSSKQPASLLSVLLLIFTKQVFSKIIETHCNKPYHVR